MATRKAQRRDGRTGITSSSVSALNRLPVYKRNYVKKRAEGGTIAEASVAAGVSKCTGSKYESESDIQAAYRELVRKAIPAVKLVKLIKGGTEAKIPVYGADGRKVGERADWRTRKPYIEMVAKHAGYHKDENDAKGNGMSINLIVNHIGQSKTEDARSQRIIEATAETE